MGTFWGTVYIVGTQLWIEELCWIVVLTGCRYITRSSAASSAADSETWMTHVDDCTRSIRYTITRLYSIRSWQAGTLMLSIHCVSKKFPPLNSLQLCQILTDFQKFGTAGKRMKFATKPMWQYPPHLRHVATIPWEIKNSNFLQIVSRHYRNAKNTSHFNHL